MKRTIKTEDKILIMLAFFSISVGLWGNFRQLWLQDNGLEASIIAKILSIYPFITTIKKTDKLYNFCLVCHVF